MSKDLRTSVLLQPRWGALPPPPFTQSFDKCQAKYQLSYFLVVARILLSFVQRPFHDDEKAGK